MQTLMYIYMCIDNIWSNFLSTMCRIPRDMKYCKSPGKRQNNLFCMYGHRFGHKLDYSYFRILNILKKLMNPCMNFYMMKHSYHIPLILHYPNMIGSKNPYMTNCNHFHSHSWQNPHRNCCMNFRTHFEQNPYSCYRKLKYPVPLLYKMARVKELQQAFLKKGEFLMSLLLKKVYVHYSCF